MGKLVARLRRTSDGEVREYISPGEYENDDDGGNIYIWTEGNYSCDCNRALFFARAGDEDDPEDTPCGEKAYRLDALTIDGEMLTHE